MLKYRTSHNASSNRDEVDNTAFEKNINPSLYKFGKYFA